MENLRLRGRMNSAKDSAESAAQIVFQPQKLKEVVEIVDLMGNIASRVREDNSGDMGSGAGATTGGTGQTGATGQSARDQAIAKAPPVPVMQKKLIRHLEREVRSLQRQAFFLSQSNRRGSAYVLAELYKRIRRLSLIISDIISASAAMIKRFYIAAFIDHQPLIIPGGTLSETEE